MVLPMVVQQPEGFFAHAHNRRHQEGIHKPGPRGGPLENLRTNSAILWTAEVFCSEGRVEHVNTHFALRVESNWCDSADVMEETADKGPS